MLEISSEQENETKEKDSASPAQILVIDDDAVLRENLKEILTQEGYKTMAVQTAKEAIEEIQKETYAVALIDIKLPDMEGTKLLVTLKKLDPALIGIIITGYPSFENAVQSLNSGGDGYLVKPFEPIKLIKQIRGLLEKRQKDRWENLLKKTGMSAYETKIYLSLALEGSSEPRKLSMSSGVPRTKTYAALKKLVQRDLVLEISGDPQKFSIIPPSGAFSSFVHNWKKELSEKTAVLAELEKTLSILDSLQEEKQASQSISFQKEEVWSIQGKEEITRRTGEMLSRAKSSLCLITTELGVVLFNKSFGKVLDKLAEKGVEIRIKVPIGSSNSNFMQELAYSFKVEAMQVSIPIFLLIVDENELLFANISTENSGTVTNSEFGLFCRSATLGVLFPELLGFSTPKEKS